MRIDPVGALIYRTIDWVEKNYDINVDPITLIYADPPLPKRCEWIAICPQSFLIDWGGLSSRERCLIIATCMHFRYERNGWNE